MTTFYRKRTFSGVYIHFDRFLRTVYKFGMIYTSADQCFKIFFDWTTLCEKLNFLKQVYLNNGYRFDKCLKRVFNKLVTKSPRITTVEKNYRT